MRVLESAPYFQYIGNMEENDAIRSLAALAHTLRLRVFRMLVVAGPAGLTPGVIAEQLDVPFLGELPLVQSIREAGDVGRPAALQQDGVVRDAFIDLARNVVSALADRVSNLPPTEAVRITTMAGCKTTKRDV